MIDERLISRLRGRGNKDTIAAADRIEALTKERDAIAQKFDELHPDPALMALIIMKGIENEIRADAAEAKLAKAVELLKEARQDLEAYVTHDWPKGEHPFYERKWERDMELCRRIDATLAEIEGTNAP